MPTKNYVKIISPITSEEALVKEYLRTKSLTQNLHWQVVFDIKPIFAKAAKSYFLVKFEQFTSNLRQNVAITRKLVF